MDIPGYDAWKLDNPYDIAYDEQLRREEAEARAEYEADMADIRNDESYFDPDDWPEIDPEQWWPDDPDLARDIERGK